jgi:glycosyltransferase involved in cell wall biosynthesis
LSERVRVFYLIDKLQRAGAQVHLAHLASGLDRARFEARVGCLLREGPVAEQLRDRGVPVECLGLGVLYRPSGWVGLLRLARRLRELRIEVLHTYLISSNVFGTLAGRLARVPVIITSRRDTGVSPSARLRVVEEWLINPLVHRVTANSRAVKAAALRERGLAEDRVVTIPNGVEIAAWVPAPGAREEVRAEWAVPETAPLVGSVGHLSPVKGHGDLLEAMAAVVARRPEARCVMVGEGPLRESLEQRAGALGLSDRITFAGIRSDVPRVLAALDLVVQPSQTEGMSNAVLEAMAAGVPVIATDTGGNPDLLRDGVSGLLVPPGSSTELASAMLRLLEDPAAARALAATARKRAADSFSLSAMIHRYEDLYAELLHR